MKSTVLAFGIIAALLTSCTADVGRVSRLDGKKKADGEGRGDSDKDDESDRSNGTSRESGDSDASDAEVETQVDADDSGNTAGNDDRARLGAFSDMKPTISARSNVAVSFIPGAFIRGDQFATLSFVTDANGATSQLDLLRLADDGTLTRSKLTDLDASMSASVMVDSAANGRIALVTMEYRSGGDANTKDYTLTLHKLTANQNIESSIELERGSFRLDGTGVRATPIAVRWIGKEVLVLVSDARYEGARSFTHRLIRVDENDTPHARDLDLGLSPLCAIAGVAALRENIGFVTDCTSHASNGAILDAFSDFVIIGSGGDLVFSTELYDEKLGYSPEIHTDGSSFFTSFSAFKDGKTGTSYAKFDIAGQEAFSLDVDQSLHDVSSSGGVMRIVVKDEKLKFESVSNGATLQSNSAKLALAKTGSWSVVTAVDSGRGEIGALIVWNEQGGSKGTAPGDVSLKSELYFVRIGYDAAQIGEPLLVRAVADRTKTMLQTSPGGEVSSSMNLIRTGLTVSDRGYGILTSYFDKDANQRQGSFRSVTFN